LAGRKFVHLAPYTLGAHNTELGDWLVQRRSEQTNLHDASLAEASAVAAVVRCFANPLHAVLVLVEGYATMEEYQKHCYFVGGDVHDCHGKHDAAVAEYDGHHGDDD
jgi:hypothetical protein